MAVVITGGNGGLARALGERFSEGSDVPVLAPGRELLDVSCESSVKKYFDDVSEVDLLICNAGKTFDSLLVKMGEDAWQQAIDVNLKGAFLCAQAAAKKMIKARKGHIIFIGSHSAFVPPVGQANYAAAKAGLVGLAKSMAQELGVRGIRVNVVVPGWMETKMTEEASSNAEDLAKSKHVLGVFNTVDAVADFVKTLQQHMLYTSGQVFHLDSRILAH